MGHGERCGRKRAILCDGFPTGGEPVGQTAVEAPGKPVHTPCRCVQKAGEAKMEAFRSWETKMLLYQNRFSHLKPLAS